MSLEQDTFILAEKALQKVVNQITDDQWNLEVPKYMTIGDDPVDLRFLINRHVYDDAWIGDTLSGKTIAEVGTKYDGDLLGDDPKASFNAAVDKAIMEVEALDGEDLDKTVNLTYGDFPVREYLKHISSYRGFRAYTIANFLGLDDQLDPALVQGLWDEVVPQVEQWRAWGVFGPAIEVPEDADQQTKLLGIVGFLQK